MLLQYNEPLPLVLRTCPDDPPGIFRLVTAPNVKLPPIPTPPATINAPVSVLVLGLEPSNTITFEVIVVLTTSTFVIITLPVTTKLPPTNKLPPTPTPPATVNAPVVVLIAGVVFVIFVTAYVSNISVMLAAKVPSGNIMPDGPSFTRIKLPANIILP